MRKRRIYGAAVLSGLMMTGAFPHLDWGWLAWIGLVPILLTLPQLRLRSALAQAFIFGVAYFGGLLYWLMVCGAAVLGPGLGVIAWSIAVTAQCGVMMIFAAGAWWLARRPNRGAWLWGVPALWTVLEWVRQLGQLGTTWGDISVSQHAYLPLLQLSKLTGSWGVTFVVVVVNMALAEMLRRRFMPGAAGPPDRTLVRFVAASLVLVGVVLVGGELVIGHEHLKPTYLAAALQPDVDPNVRWSGDRPADYGYVASTMSAYVDAGSAAGREGASVVVWPEATFPGYLRDDPLSSMLVREAIEYRQTILVGTPERYATGGPEGNAVTEISPDGVIGISYLKRHLVPWGEYVPFRNIFPILNALHLTLYDRKFGAPVQPLFSSPHGPLGVVICYESSYPELTREEVARGASLLSIVTDDTWYGRTAAPYQHANFAVLRAVENDRYVLRAAATGISEIVDPTGRVIARAPLFTSKTLVEPVESRRDLTPYSRWGDWFVWVCAGLIAALGAVRRAGDGRTVVA